MQVVIIHSLLYELQASNKYDTTPLALKLVITKVIPLPSSLRHFVIHSEQTETEDHVDVNITQTIMIEEASVKFTQNIPLALMQELEVKVKRSD